MNSRATGGKAGMKTYNVQWSDGNNGGAVSDWPEHIRRVTVGDSDDDKTAIAAFRKSMAGHGTWLLLDCFSEENDPDFRD